jgi:hypothetical protein
MTLRDWRYGVLLGAALGAVILGMGGRVAMRAAALAVEQEPAFTITGSATVVGAGTVTGVAAAVYFLVLGLVRGWGRIAKTVAFWLGTLLLALAIIWPLNVRRLELFLPLAAVFDLSFQLAWSRRPTHQSTLINHQFTVRPPPTSP